MHATDELRADRDVLLAAIRQDVQAAVFVPPDLKPGDIFKVKTKAAATAAASGRSSWQLIPLR